MATTVWFPSTGTAPISPAVSGWDRTNASFFRRPLNVDGAKKDTAMSDEEMTVSGFIDSYCCIQFVSEFPLQAQTISGTLSVGMKGRVSTTGATNFNFVARVVDSSGTHLAYLLDASNDSNLFNSTSYTDEFYTAAAITSYACASGDYLVIEIGSYVQNTTSKTIGFRIGDDTAISDVTSDSSSTTNRTGAAVFSDDLLFITSSNTNQLMMMGAGT